MIGEKRVTGKWANLISEMIDICNRGLKDELTGDRLYNKTQIDDSQNITVNSTINHTNKMNLTRNIPDLDSLIARVEQLLKKLTKERQDGFKTGTAETIRYLLASMHHGNNDSAKSLNLIIKAFEPRSDITEQN